MTRQETNLNELKCQLQVTIEGSEPFTIGQWSRRCVAVSSVAELVGEDAA